MCGEKSLIIGGSNGEAFSVIDTCTFTTLAAASSHRQWYAKPIIGIASPEVI